MKVDPLTQKSSEVEERYTEFKVQKEERAKAQSKKEQTPKKERGSAPCDLSDTDDEEDKEGGSRLPENDPESFKSQHWYNWYHATYLPALIYVPTQLEIREGQAGEFQLTTLSTCLAL